jgi:hypothetical protein
MAFRRKKLKSKNARFHTLKKSRNSFINIISKLGVEKISLFLPGPKSTHRNGNKIKIGGLNLPDIYIRSSQVCPKNLYSLLILI